MRRIAMAAVPTFSASHLVINSALGRPGGRGTHKGIGLQSAWFVLELGNYSLGFLWFFSAHFHPFPGFCMFFRPVELDFLFFFKPGSIFLQDPICFRLAGHSHNTIEVLQDAQMKRLKLRDGRSQIPSGSCYFRRWLPVAIRHDSRVTRMTKSRTIGIGPCSPK